MKKTYSFANEVFEIDSVYDYFHEFAKEYVCSSKPQHLIKNTKEEIEEWERTHDDAKGFTLEYLETLLIHAKIASLIALKNKFIFHGSAIYVDSPENGYIFAAKSGTGKSTHVQILRKVFGDRICVVNDDKPFLVNCGEKFEFYGSPWNGKDRISKNTKAALKGIFIIQRSKENKVSKIESKEAVTKLITQMYFAKGIKETEVATATLIKLVKDVPCYLLEVNMEDEAARTSMKVMEGK